MAVSDDASGPEPLATAAADEIGVATFPGFIEAEPGLFRDDEGDGRYTLYSIVYGIPLPSPRTPDDLRALELYPDEVCAHISAPFAKRPGFASDVHRRDFPLVIRAWASAALAEQRGASAG